MRFNLSSGVSLFLPLFIAGGGYCFAAKEQTYTNYGGSMGIVAVVDEQAISSFDVENRIKFIISTTGISKSPDVVANIKPQVIRSLVDEVIQLQEAKNNDIIVSDNDIKQAISDIEQARGIPAGGIERILAENNVPTKTFHDQVRAQIAWGRLLAKKVRPRIRINDDEVELAKKIAPQTSISSTINIKEVEIAVINLPVDKPKQEAEIKKLGDRLYAEIRRGASFEEVARQFSAGGDTKPFWIRPEDLAQNVAGAIKGIKEGDITAPIRANNGFSIIKLYKIKSEKKNTGNANNDTEITFKEIILKLKSPSDNQEADILLQIGKEVAKNPGNCDERTVAGIEEPENFDIKVNMLSAPRSQLPSALRVISDNLKVNEISTPFASAEGIKLYMLCGEKELKGVQVSIDKIKENIFRQKFDLEAHKYLRNLRKAAFIDVR